MNEFTRSFVASRTKSSGGAITDVEGRTRAWPFSRPLSYHVGINCDAIVATDGQLLVYRSGRVIAAAPVPAEPKSSLGALLFPRHTRKSGC